MTEPAKPPVLDRVRARYAWFDHVMRAYQRFNDHNGSFLAAGMTYYTIFAIFPLLMVGFAVVGFALSRQPRLITAIDDRIRESVSGELGQQLVDLANSAIAARASVGLIGLATATWAGLSWMSHLRKALGAMWDQPSGSAGFVRNKLSDLGAMLGMFAVVLATIGLTALGHATPTVLRWLHIPQFSGFDGILRGVSVLVSVLVSWVLFTWLIGRLPRSPVSLVASMRAGLMAAIGFELFKQLGSIYLRIVLRSPAGVAFGPVLGLMVFGFITAFLILFATAWAATASEDPRAQRVEPPGPAMIRPRIQVDEGLSTRQTLTAVAVGAVGALTFSRLARSRRHQR
ncbi:inner membrane protein YhjD [Mycobacterium spongiae]|uniref:Inner membrane protein YhjD n=1 Tax=Mycobacterium spongiae TaxID=886343 RepID=A0A975PVV4_9MYCO|nr:inner membrane protein YhjD [Mycobacterium spongiae]QUR66551.1 inner membrane protein YhjD [Mycobacterium spongiae]